MQHSREVLKDLKCLISNQLWQQHDSDESMPQGSTHTGVNAMCRRLRACLGPGGGQGREDGVGVGRQSDGGHVGQTQLGHGGQRGQATRAVSLRAHAQKRVIPQLSSILGDVGKKTQASVLICEESSSCYCTSGQSLWGMCL